MGKIPFVKFLSESNFTKQKGREVEINQSLPFSLPKEVGKGVFCNWVSGGNSAREIQCLEGSGFFQKQKSKTCQAPGPGEWLKRESKMLIFKKA